jgi:hypothetical protein
MVNHYEFGLMSINGKEYRGDIAVSWDGTVEDWRRAESHLVGVGDVMQAISKNPEIIVIGTGADGITNVSKEATKAIIEKGLNLVIDKTGSAASVFNENAAEGKRVIGLFHLTC